MAGDERIPRRLRLFRANVERLRPPRDLGESQFLSDFRNVDAAKHLLKTAIEAMIDIAVALLASRKEPLPERHADGFEALSRLGAIPKERTPTYRKMVGFRNRVVHLYEQVDDRLVYGILRDDLPDFETLIGEIIPQLESEPNS
jgi:uncharacterized protein YutE (UPF0331/DUF86 family)